MISSGQTEHHGADLRDYLRLIRSRKWEIAIVTLLIVAASMFFSLRQTPLYEGEAKVLVNSVQNPLSAQAVLEEPNLATEREILLSQSLARQVQQAANVDYSVDTLLERTRVDILTDSAVLEVRYVDPSAKRAARLTNIIVNTYLRFHQQQVLARFESAAAAVQQQVTSVRDQLAEITAKIDRAVQPDNKSALQAQRDTFVARLGVLTQRLSDLQAAQVAQDPAQLLQTSQVPDRPVSPNLIQNGVLALLVGLLLGVGLAFLRERLDDRLKSRHEIERRLGVPVIAAVPRLSGWRKRDDARLVMLTEPKHPVSESYRTLATNIQYIASREPIKVLLITSALGGEGKTTTSANLAVALAKSGKRVILISADLRKPRVHKFFNLPNDRGLSNVLAAVGTIPQVAQDPHLHNLRVIAGGPVPQDPAELLGSRRAGEFIDSLREVSDFVVVDSPPVLAVADASVLAPLVDATIFVMDADHSSRSAMLHARDQLENAGAQLVGAVYNNFDPSQATGYTSYYYYQYYGHYEAPDGAPNGERRDVERKKLRIRKRAGAHPPIGFEEEAKRR